MLIHAVVITILLYLFFTGYLTLFKYHINNTTLSKARTLLMIITEYPASSPFIFITIVSQPMVISIKIQNTSMPGKSNKPIDFFLIKKTAVKKKPGRTMDKSITCTGFVNRLVSIMPFGRV